MNRFDCKKFYGTYQDLIEKYTRSVKEMVNDSFQGYFYFTAIVRSIGFGRVLFQSIEVCRDCTPALASSCKKQLTGFFVCLLFFLKVKHIS